MLDAGAPMYTLTFLFGLVVRAQASLLKTLLDRHGCRSNRFTRCQSPNSNVIHDAKLSFGVKFPKKGNLQMLDRKLEDHKDCYKTCPWQLGYDNTNFKN